MSPVQQVVICITGALFSVVAAFIANKYYTRAIWRRAHPGMDYDEWLKLKR